MSFGMSQVWKKIISLLSLHHYIQTYIYIYIYIHTHTHIDWIIRKQTQPILILGNKSLSRGVNLANGPRASPDPLFIKSLLWGSKALSQVS